MPALPFSQALTALQSGVNPLSGWAYEFLPWPAYVRIYMRATTTGARATIKTGSQEIQPRSPIQGGGTAGTTPSPLNTPVCEFVASPGDRLAILLDEVASGTPTVDGIVYVDPA